MTTLHVGFEVGTGSPVEIPLAHMAVTGQTQRSGKTTTLEALVSRSGGMQSLAFVTKRGERAFADARRVQPYFRDRADWQFVTSLLDATLQEKNKFLRPWIMKVCRTTRSLADVQRAVREALKSAKGLNEGVYTQLDAYLEMIVPQIRQASLAQTLDIDGRGLGVMDVSAFSTPMQMLFVQSALDWINERESNTITIIPEAWEFIPEGRGSPAKSSAIGLVRKGAGIGNYIWVDSQDMAGVDKTILRGCTVWLIGVQREANEIKRTLANIPKSVKRPTAAAVALLERGEFYVCYEAHAIKTYVQPAWMDAGEAQAHARGEAVERRSQAPAARAVPIPTPEDTVTEKEARELREENERLRKRLQLLEGAAEEKGPSHETASIGDAGSLYEEFKRRLLKEPAVLRVLASKPQIDVEIKRETITIDGETWVGRVAGLVAEGLFDTPQKSGMVFKEAARRGARGIPARADEACKKLLAMGFLTREEDGFQAVPGMKVNIVEQ